MSLAENFSVDKSPSGLSRIILKTLREHFKSNSTTFIYSDPPTDKSIIIENSTAYQKGQVMQRPALYVKRGPVAFSKIALGDRSMGGKRSEGTVEYQIEMTGGHTVFCMSRVEGECEKLAEDASDVLIAFKPIIRKTFDFQIFEVTGIGEVGILEEESDVFVVPISVHYQFSAEWLIKQESLKLKLGLKADVDSKENK